jgi:hypothetical protein
MADIKPLGSEKLKADAKLKRILELTYYGENKNKTITESTSSTMRTEYLSESVNGFKYGIVKEKDGFYVKKGLNESSLDYIGGLFMKNKNRFNSYAEALKRLELLNGAELNESTKYVLKQKPSAPEGDMGALPPAPGGDMGADLPPAPGGDMGADLPPAPEGDMGADLPPAPEGDMGADLPPAPEGDMGAEGAPKPSDYMTEVQKFAGKLGQELRDQKDKMESDDIKYVLNMIISAVDLDKLDDEDIEEIGSKFDREVEDDATMGDEPLPTDDESVPEEPTGDEDLGEMMGMDKLESFVNQPIETDEINLTKYADLGTNEEDLKEIDLDEIKSEINKSIEETLGKYFR